MVSPHRKNTETLQLFKKQPEMEIRKIESEPKLHLGGGLKYFLFSSLFGEDSHFD